MRWRRRASRRFWPASCRPHLRLSHTPSTRLAGRRRRAVVELRVASHPFGILAEPRFEGALAGLLLLPRLGLARAPRRVPPLSSHELLEVDRGAADGLLLRLRRWWRRRWLRCQTLRHFDGRPGPGLLHVRGDALDLRVTPSTRRLKKDAVSRTRGENVHCLISCAYSMGALGMPMVFGFREDAVGERWTLVGLFGGGV